MQVFALALAAALLAGACATAPGSADGARPRLLVLVVADGLPQRQLMAYRDQLAPDGLARWLERGTWFSDAHYGQAYTATGPGHATMLTGAYPHRTGIIGNEWRDPVTAETVYCTADPSATYIGHATHALDGTSPRNLRAEALGDVFRRLDPRSKVISISGKDRAAILTSGAAGTAYIYMRQTGRFASTTHYMKEHPRWVDEFHARKPAEAYFRSQWRPLLDDAAYARSVPDGQSWYASGGKLPRTIGGGHDSPGPRFFGELLASPFGDALTLDFARAAIAGEALGSDDAPDILAVSLSAHDAVNHAYGAESRISHDHLLQLDRQLQAFFRDLDAAVGKDRYVAVLTSDHGFMPAPEFARQQGHDSGRLGGSQTLARLNAGLSKAFGDGRWALGFSAMGIVFNRALIADRGIEARAPVEEARRLLVAMPEVAAAYTREEIVSGSRSGAPFFEAVRKSWHSERSADLQFVLKPGWMMTSSRSGTTHGSPHPYDTHVPILFYGPRWVKAGRVDGRVEVADIAPTLARIFGVPEPSSSEGRALPIE